MLTPRDLGRDASRAGRWSRALLQGVRENLVPWVAVKGTLIGLLFAGRLGVGTAFVLDTALTVAIVAYGWRFARR